MKRKNYITGGNLFKSLITKCVQKKHNKVHVQNFFTPTTILNFEYTVLLSQSPRVLN